MFTTKGNVRGCCGHKHRSLETAVRCLREDMKGCQSQGGYSDRSVVKTDGEPLSEGEFYALDDIHDKEAN